MHSKCRSTFIWAFGVLASMTTCVWAANTAGQLPSAMVVSPQGTTTTYHIRDMGGRMLTVDMPPLASPDVKVSDPIQGTVAATVMAVDARTNQARVRTREGQILALRLPPETAMGMRVGDQFTLSIAQRFIQ